jgi:hypothetical protein
MGHVACLEYYVRGRVYEKTGRDALLNNLSHNPRET